MGLITINKRMDKLETKVDEINDTKLPDIKTTIATVQQSLDDLPDKIMQKVQSCDFAKKIDILNFVKRKDFEDLKKKVQIRTFWNILITAITSSTVTFLLLYFLNDVIKR